MANRGQNLNDRHNSELDKAVAHWLDEEWNLCSPICKDLIRDPTLPDYHKAWSHLMLATDYSEGSVQQLHHATIAEHIFHVIRKTDSENEVQRTRYKLAKRALDTAKLNSLETMQRAQPNNVSLQKRYEVARKEYYENYPDEVDNDQNMSNETSSKSK